MNDWVEQEAWRQAHQQEIDEVLRPVWVIWLGCLVEPVMLGVIAFVFDAGAGVREAIGRDASFPLGLIRTVFVLCAVAALVVAAVLRHELLGRSAQSSAAATNVPCGVLYRARLIIVSALTTAPAVFGFVLSLLGDNLATFTGFGVAAMISLLWHRPRTDELVAFCMERDHSGSTEC